MMIYLDDKVQETIERSNELLNEWDRRAIDWSINESSIVWDVGSYRGRWALQICRQYNPFVFAFEPQRWAYQVSKIVLANYKAMVFDFALGIENGSYSMSHYGTDSCSFVRSDKRDATVKMRDIDEVKQVLNVEIDLMMMNIEGYEYQLIPYMFDCGIYPRFLCVQFHESLMGSKPYPEFKQLLNQKYRNLWNFGSLLSGWELK
jgi:FkbM family methyltransferase